MFFLLRRIFRNCADGYENGILGGTGLVEIHYVEAEHVGQTTAVGPVGGGH